MTFVGGWGVHVAQGGAPRVRVDASPRHLSPAPPSRPAPPRPVTCVSATARAVFGASPLGRACCSFLSCWKASTAGLSRASSWLMATERARSGAVCRPPPTSVSTHCTTPAARQAGHAPPHSTPRSGIRTGAAWPACAPATRWTGRRLQVCNTLTAVTRLLTSVAALAVHTRTMVSACCSAAVPQTTSLVPGQHRPGAGAGTPARWCVDSRPGGLRVLEARKPAPDGRG